MGAPAVPRHAHEQSRLESRKSLLHGSPLVSALRLQHPSGIAERIGRLGLSVEFGKRGLPSPNMEASRMQA
eukprot:13930480-Alexandrium_andersonii.AAC.1